MHEEVWLGWNLGESPVGAARTKTAERLCNDWIEFCLLNMHKEGGILSWRIKIWARGCAGVRVA